MRKRWLLVLVGIGIACANADQYVYSARRYDADAGCLDPYKSIELVNGDTVSSKCPPICFRFGADTFTSTVCPPLPKTAIALDAEAPECKAANEAKSCADDMTDDDDDDDDDVLDAGKADG